MQKLWEKKLWEKRKEKGLTEDKTEVSSIRLEEILEQVQGGNNTARLVWGGTSTPLQVPVPSLGGLGLNLKVWHASK